MAVPFTPTKMIAYFKSYFNITGETMFVASGQKLQDFLTAKGTLIEGHDPDYSGKTLIYDYYSGNLDNSVASTQKWVQPYPGMLNPTIAITLIMYENNGVDPANLKLRVTNASIVDTFGYPGITPIIGPGGGGGGGSA